MANPNRIVVVDTETSGLLPGKHCILQVAALAVTDTFELDRSILPFVMYIRARPGAIIDDKAISVNGLNSEKLEKEGFDPYRAADLFIEWYSRLNCEQIEPLAQNFPFDRGFLQDWLGPEVYNTTFSRYYRDTYTSANFLKDKAKREGFQDPFPLGLSLGKLANKLGIKLDNAHNALHDAIATVEVYKALLSHRLDSRVI